MSESNPLSTLPEYVPPPLCPCCRQPMQLADENLTTRRYICGCVEGTVTVNQHKKRAYDVSDFHHR